MAEIKLAKKINWNQNLSRKQTLVASTHPPTEIRIDPCNETPVSKITLVLLCSNVLSKVNNIDPPQLLILVAS